MILEFKTKRNKSNGSRKYLCIDTYAEIYSTNCKYMIVPGIEITSTAYKEILEKCKRAELKEVEYCY